MRDPDPVRIEPGFWFLESQTMEYNLSKYVDGCNH